jgi:hypothetical protein
MARMVRPCDLEDIFRSMSAQSASAAFPEATRCLLRAKRKVAQLETLYVRSM